MKHFWHTLHSCGHAAFWNNHDLAADMHLRQPCPWCVLGDAGNKPSIYRDPSRAVEVIAREDHASPEDVGTVALYHHRKDERCCIIRIAATIGANESNDRE